MCGVPLADVQKISERLRNKVVAEMEIDSNELVLIVGDHGNAVDMKFYIKGTRKNRDFVESGRLKDLVLQLLKADPKMRSLIPSQDRNHTM